MRGEFFVGDCATVAYFCVSAVYNTLGNDCRCVGVGMGHCTQSSFAFVGVHVAGWRFWFCAVCAG